MNRDPKKIKTLSPEVVNQIAAGEVVERPAHIVKELIENAMDAGATEVAIDFDLGGRYVKVVDNGFGISSQELVLALSPHATSKIQTVHDIWALHSFGFRGEALASISSVCDLSLISKPKMQESAYQVTSQFGNLNEPVAVGGDYGTTVIVKNLFENIPARLKFLKSDAAEHSQIKNVIKAMALAHPEVTFRVRLKGKLLYFWESVEDQKNRALQVLEQDQLYIATNNFENLEVKGYLSAPNNTQKTSKQMWFFVNKRWVQDRGIQAAVMDAYRNLLMHKEFPVVALWVQAPPDEVDANIHPTKSQVKFNKPSDSYRAVHRAVREFLEKAPWVKDMLGSKKEISYVSHENFNENSRELTSNSSSIELREPKNTMVFRDDSQSMMFKDPAFQKTQYPTKSTFDMPKVDDYKNLNISNEGALVTEVNTDIQNVKTQNEFEKESSSKLWSNLQVLGQADLTYIIAQNDQSLVLIDQHAAHERVAFERLMNSWKNGQIDVQNLLLPIDMKFEEQEVEALISNSAEMERLGIYIEQLGSDQIVVTAHPQLVKEKALKWSLEELAREVLQKGGSFSIEKMVGDLCATLACHSVIRAGQALSQVEMKDLLRQMDEFPLSSFCPHGRPVYIEYPFHKIEKDFGRLV